MTPLIALIPFAQYVVRVLVFASVAIVALVALVDWLVRTRRINPFHPVARGVRRSVDPLFAPIERRVVRAGGLPSAAPLWAVAGAVVVGIIVITAINALFSALAMAAFALASGPMGLLFVLVHATFALLEFALLVRVVVSWLPVSPYSPWVRWAFALTEPILRPLRQVVPTIGMFDITPVVAYFLLELLERLLLRA